MTDKYFGTNHHDPSMTAKTMMSSALTIIGWIANHHKSSYPEEINSLEKCLTIYCRTPEKIKKLMVNLRQKKAKTHSIIYTSGAEVKKVNGFSFLGSTSQRT